MSSPSLSTRISSLTQLLVALSDPERRKFHASVIFCAIVVHLISQYLTYIPTLRPVLGNLLYFKLPVIHEAEFLLIVVYASMTLGIKAGITTLSIMGITSVPFIMTPFIFGRDPQPNEIRDLAIQVFFLLAIGFIIILLFEANEKRRRMQSKLAAIEDAKGMKDKFAAIAAHELRTPLTTIQGFSELLLREDAPEDIKLSWIRLIHKQSSRLGTLVRDMLDVSRIDSGSLEFQLEPVDIKALVLDCVSSIPKREGDSSVLSILVPDDIPNAMADEIRLSQVLTNLIENAMKYSFYNGKILINAYPDYAKVGNRVNILVQDNGIGMSQEEQSELFTPFYRVKNEKTEDIPGTGLGLYIVKSYVSGMGGVIDVKSARDKGTTFKVSLPIADALAITPSKNSLRKN